MLLVVARNYQGSPRRRRLALIISPTRRLPTGRSLPTTRGGIVIGPGLLLDGVGNLDLRLVHLLGGFARGGLAQHGIDGLGHLVAVLALDSPHGLLDPAVGIDFEFNLLNL